MIRHDASIRLSAGVAKKVLIVDDSAIMRLWLRTILVSDPRLAVIGEASNAIEARDFLREHRADVVTLDIEMPGMSGLEFLTRLMRVRPMPVVMLSSLTETGSDTAIQALSLGAIDCILKPAGGSEQGFFRDICERVYAASCTNVINLSRPQPLGTRIEVAARTYGVGVPCRRGSLFLIGASTGGVTALETLLPCLDPGGAPVAIVQHMPGNFLRSFSERLQRLLPQNIKLAEEGVLLARGDVVLAPGYGKHLEVVRRLNGWHCRLVEDTQQSLHCPSVDRLFLSAVSEAQNVTAALLTGLGRDGADGMLRLSKAGATTFGQDEATSVVYGMPRVAKEIGAVQKELPIDQIGAAIRKSRQYHSAGLPSFAEPLRK